jgi:hypothetical protein
MQLRLSPFDLHAPASGRPPSSSASRGAEAPFEETRLAAELARLMRRSPRPQARPTQLPRPGGRRPVPPGSTREALATLLVRHANPLTPSRLSEPRAEAAAELPDPESRAATAESSSPPLAAAWLQRARRRRAHTRLAEAVSWSVSIAVGVLFVAVARSRAGRAPAALRHGQGRNPLSRSSAWRSRSLPDASNRTAVQARCVPASREDRDRKEARTVSPASACIGLRRGK